MLCKFHSMNFALYGWYNILIATTYKQDSIITPRPSSFSMVDSCLKRCNGGWSLALLLFEHAECEIGFVEKRHEYLTCLLLQMKSWKKRFFVLSEASLGYYKTIEVRKTFWHFQNTIFKCTLCAICLPDLPGNRANSQCACHGNG